jgi:phosphoribosyl-ATP pyrophosphohydrolase/phosphoribosyl-AMP cyclohydrolase
MDLAALKYDERGLVPVVVADGHDGSVLTLAWANREALERTIETRETYLYSRSRAQLWHKGETSGNTQRVMEIVADCDGDAVLYRVEPHGPACHTGADSCFHEPILQLDGEDDVATFVRAIAHLRATLIERKSASPDESYVAKLYAGGVDRIGKKIGEEATEVVIAAKNDDTEELVWEASDLIFHLLVLLEERGVSLARVGEHLLKRAKPKA